MDAVFCWIFFGSMLDGLSFKVDPPPLFSFSFVGGKFWDRHMMGKSTLIMGGSIAILTIQADNDYLRPVLIET